MAKRRFACCDADEAEDGRVPAWAREYEADDAEEAAEAWAVASLSCPGDDTEIVVLVEEVARGLGDIDPPIRVRVSFVLALRTRTEVLL